MDSAESAPRRAGTVQLAGAAIWLVYLGGPLGRLFDDFPDVWSVIGILAIFAFATIYLWELAHIRWIRGSNILVWPFVAAMLVCFALIVPGAGDSALACLVFVAALIVASMPTPIAAVSVGVLLIGTELSDHFISGWNANGNGFAILLASVAVFWLRLALNRQVALRVAEKELAELAVAEERTRIARDLHDILGHSLTVISVKSELAGRLLDVDIERARVELDDLQRLSRDALSDVRATAMGVRAISLPGEIASARNALDAAGITADVPTVTEEIPSYLREPFAWTVREGVTNVIRHSRATSCSIRLDTGRIMIVDDVVGTHGGDNTGHGLEGLRERVEAVGALMTWGPGSDGRGFALSVEVAE